MDIMSAGNGSARKLSNLEAERRRLSSQRSKVSQRKISLVKDLIKIIVDGQELNDQVDLTVQLPLIFEDEHEGYNLETLVDKAMEFYNLDHRCGVQVDYWANSFGTFYHCDNLFSHRLSDSSKNSGTSLLKIPQKNVD